MKKFTKTLSIVLLVAMCVSMFTISSFAAEPCADGCTAGVSSAAKEATCTTDGNKAHYKCKECGNFYWDAACTDLIEGDVLSQVIVKAAHKLTYVEGSAASCEADGVVAHYRCSDCGLAFSDENGKNQITTALSATGHNLVDVAASAATCIEDGVVAHRKCTTCGQLFAVSQDNKISADDVVVSATGVHTYVDGICTECGAEDPDSPSFKVTGDTPQAYSDSATYSYYLANPGSYEIQYITIGGTKLYPDSDAYRVKSTGEIVIYGDEIASVIGSKNSVEIVFVATDGSTCGGFYLNNETTVDTLKVDGFAQKGFIQGSTEAVSFVTNDSNPNNVKLYSTKTQTFVTIGSGDYSMSKVGSTYTYTFNKSFLDTLDTGTYYVRCYYGTNSYVTAGTLVISLSEATTGDTSLIFSNSTVSKTEYKYVSGSAGPKLYSELFRAEEKLQVSTNGGTSWKNVSVYDYYIEQSNGKDSSYAWIKTSYLDSLPASSNVYFRVIVPAVERGTSTDAVSNWIKVTTGHTLAAVDTNKHVINSSKNLRFVCSDVIEEVYVGGQNLASTDPDAFSISKDGKYVTLYADFLNKRTAGSTYTLTVLTESGEKLSTTFQLLTTAQASASPRTGDDSNIALWSAFLLMSGAAVVAVLPRLKKEK